MPFFSEGFYDIMLAVSTILVAVSMGRYIYSILRGKTKPNMAGWLLYQIATICVLIGAYELESMPTIALTLVFSLTQLIVIILSFRFGYIHFTRIEKFYFGISMLFLIFWIFAKHELIIIESLHITERGLDIALLTANTFIEVMGALAIFTKLYHHPETEDSTSWLLSWMGGLAAIIATHSLAYEDLLYPVYLFTTNLAIWLLCFRKKPRHRFAWVFRITEKLVGKSWRG